MKVILTDGYIEASYIEFTDGLAILDGYRLVRLSGIIEITDD